MNLNTLDIKSSGLKVTLPRLRVLELFQANALAGERHLSAEEVYRLLIQEDMDIGLATVYRVLTQFEQAGLLIRRNFESGKAVFELNHGEPHDHLMCVECGLVIEFTDAHIIELQNQIAQTHQFTLSERTMTLYGVCGACQGKQRR